MQQNDSIWCQLYQLRVDDVDVAVVASGGDVPAGRAEHKHAEPLRGLRQTSPISYRRSCTDTQCCTYFNVACFSMTKFRKWL